MYNIYSLSLLSSFCGELTWDHSSTIIEKTKHVATPQLRSFF